MGGFDSSEQKSKSRGTSKSETQRSALDDFIASQRSKIGQGTNSFQGNRVAGFSDLQNQALNLAPSTLFRSQEQEQDIFENSIAAPAERRFRQETVPLINEQFAGPGFFGSARAQESVRAGEDLASSLGAQRSDLRRETEAINRQGVGSLFDFGSRVQQQEQRQIDAEMQKFMESTALTNPADAALLGQLLGLDFSRSSTNSSTSSFGGNVLSN